MHQLLNSVDFEQEGWTPPLCWFQSRALWREAARRLPSQPHLIDEARYFVDEVLHSPNATCSKIYLRRWRDVLDGGVDAVVRVWTALDDDASQVLRSCSPQPFLGLISQDDRQEIRGKVRQEISAHSAPIR